MVCTKQMESICIQLALLWAWIVNFNYLKEDKMAIKTISQLEVEAAVYHGGLQNNNDVWCEDRRR